MTKPVYRAVGVEHFKSLMNLPKASVNLLLEMLDNVDIKDNCVQCTRKDLMVASGLKDPQYSRALKNLIDNNIVKKDVIDIHSQKCIMINPKVAWSTSRNLVHFACNMYELGSHKDAAEIIKLEESLCGKVDARTGELYSEYQNRLGELDMKYRAMMEEESI